MTARFHGFSVATSMATVLVLGGCPGDDGGSDDNMTTVGMTDTTMTGSGSQTSTTSTTDLSFATDIQPILENNCVTDCHEPNGNWPTFDMSGGDLYGTIVGMPGPTQGIGAGCNLVEPGDSSMSYMYLKISGMHTGEPCQGTGVQMPALATDLTMSDPLPQDQIDMFMEWIDGGAPP